MTGDEPRTRFLNVDLDVRGSNDLTPLTAAVGDALYVLHHEAGVFASFELNESLATPAEAINKLIDHLEKLPTPARDAWDRADKRSFNVGIGAADRPYSTEYALPPQTLQRVVSIGGEIAITIYAPETAKP